MVARELCDMLCDGSHDHEHVIGGNTARLAGRYPPDLAKAFVRGLERQFEDEGNDLTVRIIILHLPKGSPLATGPEEVKACG